MKLRIRSSISGLVLLLLGVISFLLITFADWLVKSEGFSFGWQQFVGSLPSLVAIMAGIMVIRAIRHQRQGPLVGVYLLMGALAGVAAAVLALVALEPGRDFPFDSTTGPQKAYKKVIRVAGISGTGICRCAPSTTDRITLPGGFETKLSIYGDAGEIPRPAMIVAHGNVWMGGDLSTYRLIGTRLAEKGFIVAVFDIPGYGEADSPYVNGPSGVADASDRVLQLNAVIDYLIANTKVDPSNIAVFGHSGGVQWAMRTAAVNPKVAKVAIMVAPPPPVFEDVSVKSDQEYSSKRGAYFAQRYADQYRFIYDDEVPEWSSWELTERDVRYPDNPWDPYKIPGHKPILLLLGERDQPGGHPEVLRTFEPVTEPKSLIMLHRSDHYANTAQTLGFVIYDTEVSEQLTEGLASWLHNKH